MYDAAAVVSQRARTRELLAAPAGGVVLDLGCGPGHLTAELADDVGPSGRVIGLDQALDMVTAARARSGGRRAGRRDFVVGAATALPLTDDSCDGIVAVQVLEYVSDVEHAVAEVRRVLRPGGTTVLVDTDWRSCVWHTADRERTDAVLRTWEGHFVHPHLPTAVSGLLRAGGLRDVAVYPVPVVEVDPETAHYSLGMAQLIAAYVARRHPALAKDWYDDVRAVAAGGDYSFSVTRFAAVARG